jgi:uncharacterized protein (UPF0264 family)
MKYYIDSYDTNINDGTITFTFFKDDKIKSYFTLIADAQELEDFVAESENDVKLILEMDCIFIEMEQFDLLDAIALKVIDMDAFITKNL